MIDQRVADRVGVYTRRKIRQNVDDIKRKIWKTIYGSDISESVLDELLYLDKYSEFLICKTGWVRDCGDILYCSGADRRSISIMVSVTLAKGWKSVEIWGDTAFLAEARRQLEAAGIQVHVGGEPPELMTFPLPKGSKQPKADSRIVELEKELAELMKPLIPDSMENAYRTKIRELHAQRDTLIAVEKCDEKRGFLKRIFGRPPSGYDERRERLIDEMDGQTDLYDRLMQAHFERREGDRMKKIRSVSSRIKILREGSPESVDEMPFQLDEFRL